MKIFKVLGLVLTSLVLSLGVANAKHHNKDNKTTINKEESSSVVNEEKAQEKTVDHKEHKAKK